MSKENFSDVQVMQAKMIADSMLDDLLSNVHDVKKTVNGIQTFTHLMAMLPSLTQMATAFLRRIEKDNLYLSKCSHFQKRILLFVTTQSVVLGEAVEVEFSSKKQSPLETTLSRLFDVAYAFENETVPEEFCDIWTQTIKQAIIMFLKNNQPVKASRILVVYRDNMPQDQLEILENMIKICTSDQNYIKEWLLINEDGHEYSTYYNLMADFIQGLNNQLEATTLTKFATKISMSITNNGSDSTDMECGSEEEKDVSESESNPSMTSCIEIDEHAKPENAQKQNKLQNDDENESDQPSTSEAKHLGANAAGKISDIDTHFSPKISLAYRLKTQTHGSGILIPCKHIVGHCRKVNNEMKDETVKKQAPTINKYHKSSFPSEAEKSSKSVFKPQIPPRNFLLGERFEDLNTSMTSSRYSCKTKVAFNIELDSYIIAGCQHFGVGQWVKTLAAFPFPTPCTNVKLKDRFRNLIKLKHVGILDDGDVVILNKELKSRIQTARSKMRLENNPMRNDNSSDNDDKDEVENKGNVKRPKVTNMANSVEAAHDSIKKQQNRPTDAPPVKFKDRVENNGNVKRLKVANNANSVEHEAAHDLIKKQQNRRTHAPPVKFTFLEDAYLLCGVTHLGLRWDLLPEYFDFNESITASDMQKRWDVLIRLGKVSVNDGKLVCEDEDLQQKSQEITNKLKQRIQNQRKEFDSTSRDSVSSESSENSEIEQKAVRPKKYIVDNSSSEDPEPTKKTQVKNKSSDVLNTSIDVGTQTKRSKVVLRNHSPSILEESNSRSEASLNIENQSDKVGLPKRQSVLNFFKRPHDLKKPQRHKREFNTSFVKEMRERRQREISRQQRKTSTPRRNQWKDTEVKELLKGLSKHGPGKWAEILEDGWDIFNDRTSVMLKDKFRNMLKTNSIPDGLISS